MKTIITLLFVTTLTFSSTAATINVTSTADIGVPGQTTLRDAIAAINAAGTGPHEINFQVAGTITLNSDLPTITNSNININGYTAPGSTLGTIKNRIITIAINLRGFNGFNVVSGGGITISGFSIYNTSSNTGVNPIQAGNRDPTSGIWIWGCFIGVNESGDITGTTNTESGIRLNSVNNFGFYGAIIGTNGDGIQDAYEGNIITNTGYDPTSYRYDKYSGIFANNIIDLVIAGNFIGPTDRAGNSVSHLSSNNNGGILLKGCRRVTIGTNGNLVSDDLEGNVISGNGRDGIRLLSIATITIAGNIVGLGADGTTELGNGSINALSTTTLKKGTNGICFSYDATATSLDIIIGTNSDGKSDLAERNIISAQKQNISEDPSDGIELYSTQNVLIAGNYIGTDITGTLPKGNSNNGIGLYPGTFMSGNNPNIIIGYDDNKSGTFLPVMRNIISANGGSGIEFTGMTGNPRNVAGNYIGLNANGTSTLGNRNGIKIQGTPYVTIGSDGDGVNDNFERNYICNNSNAGVLLHASATIDDSMGRGRASNTKISGNNIGVDILSQPAGNSYGVLIIDGSNNNIIGSDPVNPLTNKGNIIGYNNIAGVAVGNLTPAMITGNNTSLGNLISRNSFISNGGLSIDLLDRNIGVDVNDGISINDGVIGPSKTNSNNVLDYPIFTKFLVNSNGTITVSGYVGKAGATEEIAGTTINEILNIEIYQQQDNGNQDGAVSVGFPRITAHGEGKLFLGAILTDATGKFTDQTFMPEVTVSQTDRITGTASRLGTTKSTSEFGLMSNEIILPVTLIKFEAKVINKKVSLFWSTTQEINSAFFEIERSMDIKNWETIAHVKSVGNSNILNNYNTNDELPIVGTSYYRLKQVDLDGKNTYYTIRAVDFTPFDFKIYPNPVKNLLSIESSQLNNIQVLNRNGIIIPNVKINQLGTNKAILDISILTSDIYFIKIGNEVHKIVKD